MRRWTTIADPGRRLPIARGGGGARCPVCGRAGEATGLFRDVYACVTEACRVWTFEDAPASEAGRSSADVYRDRFGLES